MSDESVLQEAFYSALALCGKFDYFIQASFSERRSLSARVALQDGVLKASVGKAFEAAPRDALVGLALSLCTRLFRRKPPEEARVFEKAFKEFSSRESVAGLSDSLKAMRGRKPALQPIGRFFDLRLSLAKVLEENASLFQETRKPLISWSRNRVRGAWGWFDSAFQTIFINKGLDSPRTPSFAVEFIVFHELLHAKHRVLFQRGESLRRTVHPTAFKRDEKSFRDYGAAKAWLGENNA